jgi:uncharacterized protein (UPF0548 family)
MDLLMKWATASLAAWQERPFWPGTDGGPGANDHRDAYEREVAREPPGDPLPDGPHRQVAVAILSYRVFPPEVVTGVLRRAPVEVGDTVGIRYHLGPIDLFFAARVIERFDARAGERWRTGFTYRTLVGHPELGEETFSVEKDVRSGAVIAALRSWSRPGTRLARIARPIVRRLQISASERALDHLGQAGRGASSPASVSTV